VTKLKLLAGSLALITTIPLVLTRSSWAGEPRPWLCRDKPVFSDSHPMQYQVSAKRGVWQIFFMQFQINAAHDGFSILESRELTRTPQSGTLPSGQYYAVALYEKGGAWICSYGEESSRAPGDIKNLCYGPEDDPSCPATLLVRSTAH
jgi:hypothetical protein